MGIGSSFTSVGSSASLIVSAAGASRAAKPISLWFLEMSLIFESIMAEE